MVKKVILVLIVLGVLIGGYFYIFLFNKSHPDYENMDADLIINAEELFNECKAGNAANYTGKLLEVTGIPDDLEVNDSLYIIVYLFDEGMFGPEGVRATLLPNHVEKAKKIGFANKESETIIKAYCTGYNGTDVILEKGSIVDL